MKSFCVILWNVFILLNIRLVFARIIHPDNFADEFYIRFKKYFSTAVEDDALKDMKNIITGKDDAKISLIGFPLNADAPQCLACYSIAHSFLNFQRSNGLGDITKNFSKLLCTYIERASESVCDQEVEINYPYVKYSLENGTHPTLGKICGILYQRNFCISDEYEPIGINVERPALLGSKEFTFESSGNLTILHLTDFHYDPYYETGSASKCDTSVCCRASKVDENAPKAGNWGDYNACDTPKNVIESILQHASSHKNIDLIYFTGDYVDHFSWNITKDHNKRSIKFIMDLVKQYFPGVPVYPTLGNHESYPSNFFSPSYIKDPNVSSQWLFDHVADLWKEWLPADALITLRKGGYYTTLARPKLRIVALNTNVCYAQNWWLLHDDSYFEEQLQWLLDVLYAASNSGERVHILGHVPSNDLSCYRHFTSQYNKLVGRFADIIAGQYNGHSHYDEFVVFNAEEFPFHAVNVAWNGGSGTSFVGLNSNYRIAYVDNQTYEILDYDTWIFNLTAANLQPNKQPEWYKEYSFKSYFGVPDMSPSSISKLVDRFASNKDLLRKFWRIKVKNSDEMLKRGCDEKCLSETLHSISTSTFPRVTIANPSTVGLRPEVITVRRPGT